MMRQSAIPAQAGTNRQSSSRASTRQAPLASSHHSGSAPSLPSLRGFTLVELLVAIVVLLAVIIALSRIFATASDVAGIGQATATILQEAAVIERRMREDIENLSPDGIFAIRQVAVPNNVNGDEELLDPALPPNHVFRADQLLFFTDRTRTMETSRLGGAAALFGQGAASRVYWGHAFQLPNASGYEPGPNRMHDPLPSLTPWHRGNVQMVRTFVDQVDDDNTNTNIYSRVLADVIDGTQPPPRRWLLARQAVTLVDDDTQAPNTNAKTVFLSNVDGILGGGNQTARSIFLDSHTAINVDHPVFGWSREIRNGRMDAAASLLSEVRRYIRSVPWQLNDAEPPRGILARELPVDRHPLLVIVLGDEAVGRSKRDPGGERAGDQHGCRPGDEEPRPALAVPGLHALLGFADGSKASHAPMRPATRRPRSS
jgi:prepilin-type N-terminal cleavage/methylation domain-containing protein